MGKINILALFAFLLFVFASCNGEAKREQARVEKEIEAPKEDASIKVDTTSIYSRAVRAGIDTTSKSYNDLHQELFKRAVDSVLENVRLLKEPPK